MAFSMSSTRMAAPLKVAAASSFKGDVRPLAARPAAPVALRAARLTVSAADAAPAAAAPAVFVPPPLDPNTPSPIFGGSTGGLLRKAQVEEFYVITWTAKKEQIFEMPTGGAAFMREGPNLLKLARKEQCMALLTQLRTGFKTDGKVYRVYPSGEVQYLHPKDGVYPEKLNKGRVGVNNNMRSIGKNPNPATIKFGGKLGPYEA